MNLKRQRLIFFLEQCDHHAQDIDEQFGIPCSEYDFLRFLSYALITPKETILIS